MNYRTPRCPVCKRSSDIEIDDEGYAMWKGGAYVQNAFPDLDADDRELLITGTHPACWEKIFGGFDD